MVDHEANQRTARQRRALQVHGGAKLVTEYQHRRTKAVAVNEQDLRELLNVDGVELALTGVGQFMASGSLWLFLDRYFSSDFSWTALTGFCASAFVFGVVLVGCGLCMRLMKRRRIKRIFEEC